MLYLSTCRKHLKADKKNAFEAELMIQLTVQSKGESESTFDGGSKDAFSDLHKDT